MNEKYKQEQDRDDDEREYQEREDRRWDRRSDQHAKLIAAAPEVLEMLKLIVQRGAEQSSTAGARLNHADWLKAKSVVAKVEGSAE